MIGGELQKAIVTALKVVTPVADGRIFDQVPPLADYPYVTVGNEQVLDDGTTCGDGWEVYSDVHVWSRPTAGSKLEAKELGRLIVQRLAVPLTVAGFIVVSASLETMRSFRDLDGTTEHAILTFRYLLDPTE